MSFKKKRKETRKRAKKAHSTRNWVIEVSGNRGLGSCRQKKKTYVYDVSIVCWRACSEMLSILSFNFTRV